VFAVADTECCVPAASVQTVERLGDVTPVPNTVAWVRGVVQIRGSIVSVIDLPAFLGLPPSPQTSRTRLLVISYKGMTVGCIVDAVLEMRADSAGMRQASDAQAPAWLAPYVAKVFDLDQRRIAVLDVPGLLLADKMHQYRSDVG
jgi:purine-binding chemotaxis protein CheW